ncbi:MAG: excinuclease ABC subunit UvrC [Candidatus Midichloria mitochondrii]|nr:excinuclease ABC subunit UvrC [Candidatus Midichloria mitochondrii]MDJ1288083.1 excinuclease ABC subunit UvrC [Candidatus Midichloria mitochondrii]MDJ1298935.1 excinuclease ABC subunit UvrC [Candidatus Midichloria mitochondrii]MDJ1313127.1 excinuclease ABC subunit UvrC [Candidatus Midichloria mitochondrii]MDJ1583672.1 excinuclease ABC subunit UvrC [Candidatus Midichloria mitochondrii]
MSLETGIKLINQTIKDITEESGVYKMVNAQGEIMYVGKAKNLVRRVHQYTQIERLPNRLRLMVSLLTKIEVLITKSEEEALLLEAQLIKGLRPKFNIALKSDKSFPYLVIENVHKFPRIFKYRGAKKEKNSYFGPFLVAGDLENLMLNIQKIFKLRSCSDKFFSRRQRPCLLYQISRCSAPCVDKISEADYNKSLKRAKKFLSGDVAELRNELIKEMEIASENLQFEKAAEVRYKIQLFNQLQTEELYSENAYDNIDVFAIYSMQLRNAIQVFSIREGKNVGHANFFLDAIEEGDEIVKTFLLTYYAKKAPPSVIAINYTDSNTAKVLETLFNIKILNAEKDKSVARIYSIARKNAEVSLIQHMKNDIVADEILQQLQNIFDLDKPIQRIEVYDNSHIQGKYAVGCRVVSDGKQFIKDEYRIFKIRQVEVGDDYSMMHEVLMRRFKKLESTNIPDLILIDGGPNHLAVASSVLKELNVTDIRAVAIAKGPKRNAGEETFYLDDGQVINFAKDDKVLHYLQRLRDEAHRFAISTHRKLRQKETITSLTSTIPGIGSKRQKILLSAFGSYEKIKRASLKELQQLPNFGKNFALEVYNYLHSKKDE